MAASCVVPGGSDGGGGGATVQLTLPPPGHMSARMRFFRQLNALFYKEFVILKLKRHYIASLFELILPLVLVCFIAYLRSMSGETSNPNPQVVGAKSYPAIGPFGRDDIYFYRFHNVPASANLLKVLKTEQAFICFAPNTSYTQRLMDAYRRENSSREIVGFDTKQDLAAFLTLGTRGVSLVVLFDDDASDGTEPSRLGYTLRFNNTQFNFHVANKFASENKGPRSAGLSFEEKHLLWPSMSALFEEHLKYYNLSGPTMKGGHFRASPKMKPFPTPQYVIDEGLFSIVEFIPTIVSAGFVAFLLTFCRRTIEDKQTRIRELLRMMGMKDFVYWANLVLVASVTMGIIVCMTTLCLCYPLFGDYPVLMKSDPSLIFTGLWIFGMAAILQILLITVFFNSSMVGTLVAVIVWLLSEKVASSLLDPPNKHLYMSLSASQKLWSSLLPTNGLYWMFKLVAVWEQQDAGARWSNVARIAQAGDNISMLSIMAMMVVSWLAYAALIFYLDAVIPWQLGIPKHPLFIFRKSYWWPSLERDLDPADAQARLLLRQSSASNGSSSSKHDAETDMFEPPADSFGDPVIVLRGVTHGFGAKKAIDDLSLQLYRDQITVVLGHNGAGKTTTMNVLTGLFPPNQGEIYINGYSVRENTVKARQGIGLCPQHNVLFDELTVTEHLRFFSMIKGSATNIDLEICQLLEKFDLCAKKDDLSKSLSGGQKRKLSMANAMVGGSNILILDEPTAGMDPQARRGVWSILQEARRSRTILLTTHYMEEADVLGDRIAFLAAGKLKCAGSPMFLKKKFETGYNMRCAKLSKATDVQKVVNLVEQCLGSNQVHLAANLGLEFCVNLGFPSTDKLVELFQRIEAEREDLGIGSVGVSVTTMEDVFLKVGELDIDYEPTDELPPVAPEQSNAALDITERFPRFERTKGWELWSGQFGALVLKRVQIFKRQWYMLLFLIGIPVFLILLFCYLDAAALTPSLGNEVLTYSFETLPSGGSSDGFMLRYDNPEAGLLKHAMEQDGVNVRTLDLGENVTSYLLRQADADPVTYKAQWTMGLASDSVETNEDDPLMWFNGEPYHVGAAALTHWQAAVLGKQLNHSKANPVSIRVRNHPLGSALEENNVLLLVIVRFFSVIPISVATSFLTCSLIIFPIQERISKAKLVQMMSGVHPSIYFGSAFLFDFVVIAVSSALMVIACVIYDPAGSFTTFGDTWVATLVLLCMYGSTMIPLTYLLSYLFRTSASGFSTLVVITVICGSILVLTISIIDFIGFLPGNPLNLDLARLATALHVLNFVPPFAVVWGFTNVHINGISKMFCESFDNKTLIAVCTTFKDVIHTCCSECPGGGYCFKHESPFQFDVRNGAGYQILSMVITGFVAFLLLLLVESSSQKSAAVLEFINWQKIRNTLSIKRALARRRGVPSMSSSVTAEEDSDVVTERQLIEDAVARGRQGEFALVAHNLTKFYGSLKAVGGVSFRVDPHECFGLLGVNGAGKTTTFGMLTGDHAMSDGNAYIGTADLRASLRRFQAFIGYCPQFNALLDTMSGREMLELFCALRGVPRPDRPAIVSQMITMADLGAHANKPTAAYSGGNKRKLSIALAMIGNPSVLFLDEPTAGVDPAARRKIWSTLLQAQRELGTAVILTSHSMEECEALCHRVAIMVNGTLRCLGSSQHLKAKFGQGFTLQLKLKPSADESVVVAEVCAAMDQLFPGENKLKDCHQCLLQFHVTDTSLPWSVLFARVEQLKRAYDFEDVVVSDTSLEQIFLAFAKTQRPAEDSDNNDNMQAKTKVL